MRYFILMLMLLNVTAVFGQNFRTTARPEFKDGIYKNYQEFLGNMPSVSFNEVDLNEKPSKFFNKRKFKNIRYRDKYGKRQKMEMNDIWGVCINGVPYIQYMVFRPRGVGVAGMNGTFIFDGDFTRLRVLGNICHFNIEDIVLKPKGYVTGTLASSNGNTKLVSKQKILKLETGEVRDFTERNLKLFIEDDPLLCDHFLKNKKREDKMFIYLQKYNERNPVILADARR